MIKAAHLFPSCKKIQLFVVLDFVPDRVIISEVFYAIIDTTEIGGHL